MKKVWGRSCLNLLALSKMYRHENFICEICISKSYSEYFIKWMNDFVLWKSIKFSKSGQNWPCISQF